MLTFVRECHGCKRDRSDSLVSVALIASWGRSDGGESGEAVAEWTTEIAASPNRLFSCCVPDTPLSPRLARSWLPSASILLAP